MSLPKAQARPCDFYHVSIHSHNLVVFSCVKLFGHFKGGKSHKCVFSVLLLLCYVKMVLLFHLIYTLYPEAIQATSPLSFLNLHFMSFLLLQIHSGEQSMLCEAERTVCCEGAQHVRVGWCN